MPPASAHALTPQEAEWCLDLAEHLSASGIAIPSPPLLLAQFAIVGKGDLAATVKRIVEYQRVAKSYGYVKADAADSPADRLWFHAAFPGLVQPCWPLAGRRSVLFVDPAVYDASGISWPAQWPAAARSFLLLLDALSCDLDEARAGCEVVYDCKGLSVAQVSPWVLRGVADLYQNAYPGK